MDFDELLQQYYYCTEDYEGDVAYRETYTSFRPSFLCAKRLNPQRLNLPTPSDLTPEEADRNAEQLVEEEEKEKEKADKKKLKKQKQKERKRQQKVEEPQYGTSSLEGAGGGQEARSEDDDDDESCDASVCDDDLDLGSTFVRQAKKKVERKERARERAHLLTGATFRLPSRETGTHLTTTPPTLPHLPHNTVPGRLKIQESLVLANVGNQMAAQNQYMEALHYYTEAIKLNPSDFRFLGNRSYVFDLIGRHEESLADAETALRIQPTFLKGYFRKGRALRGLQRYTEAIAAFQQVLLFDAHHVEAAAEVLQCQQKMMEAMTSSRVIVLGNDPLCPLPIPTISVPGQNSNVFVPRNTSSSAKKDASGRIPGVPPNIKLYPVWVGNVNTRITYAMLIQLFEPFGFLYSVRILYERMCAFVNFTNKEAAEAAYSALQGTILEGAILALQLRHPEHKTEGSRKAGK